MKFYDYDGTVHHSPFTTASANVKILVKKHRAKMKEKEQSEGYARAMQSSERQYLKALRKAVKERNK